MFDLIRKINLESKTKNINSQNSLAFNQKFVAYTHEDTKINVLEYRDKFNKGGHYNQIKYLKFSNNSKNLLLCSSSIDYVICWNMSKIVSTGVARGTIIGKNLQYEPVYCSFHPSDEFLMICSGNSLCFFDVNSDSNLGEIKCKEFVNSAEFCLFNTDLIVVNSHAAYFDFYLYSTNQLLFSLKCELSAPYLNICSLADSPIILTTSSNGNIFVYDASINEKPPNLIKTIPLNKLYMSFFYKNFNEPLDTEASMLCMGIELLKIRNRVTNPYQSASNEQHFEKQYIIACATPTCVFFIDLDSADIINLIDFKIKKLSIMPQLIEFDQSDNNNVAIAVVSLFQSEINIFNCEIQSEEKKNTTMNNSTEKTSINSTNMLLENGLSVLTQDPILDDSPLKEELKPESATSRKPIPSMQEYMKTAKYLKKDSLLKDKPLTFTSKIKSSGYSAVASKQKPFQPKTNRSTQSSSYSNLEKLASDWPKKPNQNDKSEVKQFEFQMPNKLVNKLSITDGSKSVFLLKFSDDARIIASGQADNMVHCLYADNLDKNSIIFNGHKDFLRAIDISHDGKYLISAGNDKTCKLWHLRKPNDLLLDLPKNFTPSNSKNNAIPLLTPSKDAFKKDVTSCCFFYMDKFIAITNENKIFLYSYYIDMDKPEIQSYINNSICKLVKTLNMTYSQSITCTSAINSFYSYLIFCGGSDKSLEVFDLNKCQSSLIITDAHSRVFHQITQNSTEYNQHSYDFFLTNSIGDGIKIWDLRTARCIKKFDQHVSRGLACKTSQSCCGNYIATGSEDRSTYIYDIRMNGVLEKFGGFSDTVMATAFHPKKSELYCGTLDGNLYCYKKV